MLHLRIGYFSLYTLLYRKIQSLSAIEAYNSSKFVTIASPEFMGTVAKPTNTSWRSIDTSGKNCTILKNFEKTGRNVKKYYGQEQRRAMGRA